MWSPSPLSTRLKYKQNSTQILCKSSSSPTCWKYRSRSRSSTNISHLRPILKNLSPSLTPLLIMWYRNCKIWTACWAIFIKVYFRLLKWKIMIFLVFLIRKPRRSWTSSIFLSSTRQTKIIVHINPHAQLITLLLLTHPKFQTKIKTPKIKMGGIPQFISIKKSQITHRPSPWQITNKYSR